MSKETKILRENIKNFRHLIMEGANPVDIAKYINNHEYIYIYYNANNEDGKNAGGYRTIRPYVLGTSKSGNKVLRAWQDNPKNSWHFSNKATRPDSQYHDYWSDSEGVKPGWRMFDIDKISKIYPIGKHFNDKDGNVMIPAGYREGSDADMVSIEAYVSTGKEPNQVPDKEYHGDVLSRTDQRKAKWDSIRNGNKNNRQISGEDVVKLRDIASRVYKKKQGNFLVVIDDKNNIQLLDVKDKQKQNIPDNAIYGSLPHLYDTLVNGNKEADNHFFRTKLSQTQQGLSEESPTIPHKRMTFFK